MSASDALRVGLDVVRLTGRVTRDPTVPRRTRIVPALSMADLLCPIDLIRDLLPVIGYLDDVLIAELGLRIAVRGAGYHAVERHWSGTLDGLSAVFLVTGSSDPKRSKASHNPTLEPRL